ncbi:MAG: hypothetical protein ACJAZB_001084 [Psychrosphaera sp.]|jgi:hypothetical protein
MGILKTSLTIAVLSLGVVTSASAATYVSADDTKESQLCVAAATESKIGMYIEARDYKPSNAGIKNLRFLANNLYCNGVNVADFAKSAGNDIVSVQLNRFRNTNVQIRDLAKMSHGTVYLGNK